jgi:hypothetical protein
MVVVTVLLDDHGLVTIPAVPIPKVFAVAVTIAIAMNFAHGHTVGTDTDSDLFRASGNRAADAHHGDYSDCVLYHCRLLSM